MAGLSVIIITKNEALNIRECLESIKWADEIIVVDSGSTDDTVSICREYTRHVYILDWPGFGIQKNRALSYATQDWVLSLDADERVTPELRSEIINTMLGSSMPGYEIPRLSSFCGRYMHHSGWYPDFVTRLFLRNNGKFSNDLVHERVIINGQVGRLKNNLLHESFRDLEQLLAKMNHYSSAGAEMLSKKGRDATLTQAIFHGLWAFFRSYILRAGFLDGREGFMLAVSTAEGTYYRYVKRLLMQQREQAKEINVVEPTLSTEAGHCFSFVSALLDASTVDIPFRLWINKHAQLSFKTGHVRLRKYFYRRLRRIQAYFLYRKLLKLENKLFIATAGRADLLALHWAASGMIPPRKVYLYFHWFNPSSRKMQSLKAMAGHQPDLVILGPTPSVVNAFKEAGFRDVRVVPYPITPKEMMPAATPGEFRHVLYAGAARQDKGFKYIVDLIEYLERSGASIPVLVQTSAEHFGKCDAETLADIERLKASPYPHLTLKTEVLSAAEYNALYSGAIVIQLYRQADFYDRISGVTLDAFTAGCPIVTTSDTWMARMAKHFDAGLVADDMSAEAVQARIKTIIAEYPRYHANALQGGQILQQENSASALYQTLIEK